MHALSLVMAMVRPRATALAMDAARFVALRAAVALFAAVALGFFTVAAIMALSAEIGLMPALAVAGLVYAVLALAVYMAARRPRSDTAPTYAMPVLVKTDNAAPPLSGSLLALGVLALAGYVLAQKVTSPTSLR